MIHRYIRSCGPLLRAAVMVGWLVASPAARSAELDRIEVEGQPLGANVKRLIDALEFLGAPLNEQLARDLQDAADQGDAGRMQDLLDPWVTVAVTLNPEARVKAVRGPAKAVLQQGGYTPVMIKVINESTVTKGLNISSPQAGPIFAGGRSGVSEADAKRFLDVEMFTQPPMTAELSGLAVEYALALVHSSQAGKREATLRFDIGQETADLGFRSEVPILFTIRPAVAVKLSIVDHDGQPTTGRFVFRDGAGRVYPPQAKRLAPDFFFQQQIYRHDGGTVLLPPGELSVVYGRGPEYRQSRGTLVVPDAGQQEPSAYAVRLERWVNPMDYGFYSGDHHIHAAGCAHYTNPTEGVLAEDMFLHIKGEGLNVGCNLTWGPCYNYQRQFFEPTVNKLSEPFTLLKYDVEVSGFGSQALGHVCLLNLRDQTYPGSEGGIHEGWPTWTTPLMKWAKQQGAVTGYAHSASGLQVKPPAAAGRLVSELDAGRDGQLDAAEAAAGLLPEGFDAIDRNQDGNLAQAELEASIARVANVLPNLAIPEMNGIGAQEICVTAAQGLCDFISAMDTARVPEWNCWYHVMNCGFPLKVSGETDFPCVSDSRVGQGRVYVQLGEVDQIDFTAWCNALAQGRSYVSDGYAHPLQFSVRGKVPGETVALDASGPVEVKALVAFASEMPLGTSQGGWGWQPGPTRLVELVVNGRAVASAEVPADDAPHEVTFSAQIDGSSWVALRHFPQMHTNPVNVLVAGKPIRASRASALWCLGTIEQLWRARGEAIAQAERDEARATFERAKETYRQIASEAPEGS